MRIDLHTHSDRSDGTLPPSEVVRAAAAAGLDVVALTDHDTAAGWDEAAAAAQEVGVTLVRGMEISCVHAGEGLHLLAYLPDATHPPLVEALAEVLRGREDRVPRICAALRALGIPIDEDDVRASAQDASAIGRPHIADRLVTMGVVASRDEAFDRLLSPGRPGYVRRYAAPVEDMLPLVTAAGGVPVVAHPWGRHDPGALQLEGLASLRQLGLRGVEVDHQDHTPEQRAQLRALAAELDLVVTGSSDFHGAGKVGHDLGCNLTAPNELERLLSLAAAAAEASGRPTPAVVGR